MKNKKLPSLVVIMILTLITTLFWVSFTIYRSFNEVPDINVPANVLTPITPSLDDKTVNDIVSRTYP